jgi:hypothetical protein
MVRTVLVGMRRTLSVLCNVGEMEMQRWRGRMAGTPERNRPS